MPSKERTRKPAPDQGDLTSLLQEPLKVLDETQAQQSLIESSERLQKTLTDPEAKVWQDSPFAWLRQLPAASKGRAAERLVAGFLSQQNLLVSPAQSPGHAFVVTNPEPVKVKVKLSLRWATGELVFQQVTSGDYDKVVLLGIEPQQAHAWVLERHTITDKVDESTGWVSFPVSSPPSWLAGFDSQLSTLASRLLQ